MLGFLPSCFGPKALYWTVYAVESFVEEHYNHQICRLQQENILPNLQRILKSCCEDEIEHKEEAALALLGTKSILDIDRIIGNSVFVRIWIAIVDKGSRVAVALSKII